jgi:hypothetical protein
MCLFAELCWCSTLIFCLSESDREQIDACIRDLLAEEVK